MKMFMRNVSLILLFVLIISLVPAADASEKHFYNPIAKKYLTFETSGSYYVKVMERAKPMTCTAGDFQIGRTIDTRTIKYAGQTVTLTAAAYMNCVNSCKYIGMCMPVVYTGNPYLVGACAATTGVYCGAQCTASVVKIFLR